MEIRFSDMHSHYHVKIDPEHRCLSTTEAAKYLGLKNITLRTWRLKGVGPKYVKLEGNVRYLFEDLEVWLAQNKQG
jgi:predicted DNA-binding transcriptional regulator AlpA